MLIYHPAFDAYHCVFRMLTLIQQSNEIDLEMLRLCDFYLVFPSEIEKIRLPKELTHGRNIAKAASNLYRNPINTKQTFRDMSEIQVAALRNIAASGLISLDLYERGLAKKNSSHILSNELSEKINSFLESNIEIFNFIINSFMKFPLHGINGLKDRTGLLEHRYDITH